MNWSKQYEVLEAVISHRLADNGKKFTRANAAKYLGVPANKLDAWKKGQPPSFDDLYKLAREFDFRSEWLLMGIGEPVEFPLNNPFNPRFVEICDTLHELVYALPDSLERIAEVGGMTTMELRNCINTQAFPPAEALAKWILYYRIDANFLLAQIGTPFLSETKFFASGPLDSVREHRGDFSQEENIDDMIDGVYDEETYCDILEKLKAKIEKLKDTLLQTQEKLIYQQQINIDILSKK